MQAIKVQIGNTWVQLTECDPNEQILPEVFSNKYAELYGMRNLIDRISELIKPYTPYYCTSDNLVDIIHAIFDSHRDYTKELRKAISEFEIKNQDLQQRFDEVQIIHQKTLDQLTGAQLINANFKIDFERLSENYVELVKFRTLAEAQIMQLEVENEKLNRKLKTKEIIDSTPTEQYREAKKRKFNNVGNSKVCRKCGKTYKPISNGQKDCPDCTVWKHRQRKHEIPTINDEGAIDPPRGVTTKRPPSPDDFIVPEEFRQPKDGMYSVT